MKQELSKTTVAVAVGLVVVVLIAGALWMWRKPAGSGGNEPSVGTPQSAAAMRARGQEMRDSFMAGHRRGRQPGGGAAEPSDQ